MKTFLALLLAGCSDVGVVKHALDADSDGYSDDVDCDEAHATVNPDADEVCDGLDNDCDGTIDEDVTDAGTWYPDADGDTYGDAAGAVTGCEAPAGFVLDGTDCDDADATVSPGSDEVCNLVDDDCDGDVDDADASLQDGETWYADSDGDAHGDAGSPMIACVQPEGYVPSADDCDDGAAAVSPDALEVCDAADVDEDCDGLSDDADDSVDPAGRVTAWPDDDVDGYGDATRPFVACDPPADTVADATDCLDTDGSVNPAAAEVCDDGVDNNCDGAVDEGCGGGDLSFCDGANTGDSYSDGTSMGGPDLLLGMAYTPDGAVDVGRIEVFTGEGAGTNRVSVWTDVGGAPDTEIAVGSWDMDRANGWQGADLDTCVPLEAGVTYWLVWAPINGSQATWDTSGEMVRYRGSFDGGGSWNGPYESYVKYRVSCCE